MTAQKRALIVDDDDPIRGLLTKVLQGHDLDVDTARDGVEAIDQLDRDGYSVILLDLMMPRVDGFGVLRHIQKNYPEILHRTIVATAVPETEISRHFDGPVFRVHSKPFDLHALMADIDTCTNVA